MPFGVKIGFNRRKFPGFMLIGRSHIHHLTASRLPDGPVTDFGHLTDFLDFIRVVIRPERLKAAAVRVNAIRDLYHLCLSPPLKEVLNHWRGDLSSDISTRLTGSGDGTGGNNDSNMSRVERVNSRTVPGRRAKLRRDGLAVAPRRAPIRVKRVIWAANEIARGKGYCWGGGHGRHNSPCYDCSGAASYALRGGNFVRGSRPSTGYFNWGRRGRGNWITVFTNSGHMYITVAGLRFDTGMVSGRGPSWSDQMRSDSGFRKRRPARARF
jgi:hypothetical protein